MRARSLSLLFLVAILFSAFGTASSGAAEAVMASHGSEIIAAAGHVEDAGHEEHRDPAGDAPCHSTAHHHCSIAVAVEVPSLGPAFAIGNSQLSPISASALASLSQAPPTQPPSA